MEMVILNRLSSEYINSLPVTEFKGQVLVVDSNEKEQEAFFYLKNEPQVGFDTESKPAFKKGESYPVSLVQFATPDRAFLFQLEKTGFSDTLMELLAAEKLKKIGIGVKNDIEKLQQLRKFNAGGFIDLSVIAKEKGIIQVGARALTARYLAKRLVKSAQKTNWANDKLTRRQQLYAASDAWICLHIYPLLMSDPTDYRQIEEQNIDEQ